MPKTRNETVCEIFGVAVELKLNVLPTYADIMKAYLWLRIKQKETNNGKDPSISEVSKELINILKNIWHRASLPVVSDQQILRIIKNYNDKYKSLKKNINAAYNKKCLEKLNLFKKASQKLFDISACKCKNFAKCQCTNKVPKSEREFLIDQRTNRKMFIGNLDTRATKCFQRRLERKNIETKRTESQKIQEENSDHWQAAIISFKNNETTTDSNSGSPSYVQNFSGEISSAQNSTIVSLNLRGIKLTNLADACDRTGVSDRSASLIANAVLQDLGVVSQEDTSKLVDRSKIRRERKKRRLELKDISKDNLAVTGVYFDGRKDKTLVIEKIDMRHHRKLIAEEHIVLVSEPGSKYLGHVTPTTGSAISIKTSILDFLEKRLGNNLHKIVVVGCDGTVINTGLKNGVIRQLEVSVGHSVQWFICLLHANELPLRHLIQNLDGKTNDPKGFSGVIGKSLEKCQLMPVANFAVIHAELPVADTNDLSTDQKYLYQICIAIGTGEVSSSLANRDPGKMAHSRWLTTANRILRVYVGTENPSSELQIIAEYIVKVYAPTWFEIKSKPFCTDGPIHLFGIVNKSRYVADRIKNIIDPVIQRNAYFSHPENILLAMITDDKKHVRELGLRRILKCRNTQNDEIREFKVPKLNFEAHSYMDLIDWQSVTVTEPPLTRDIPNETLKEMILIVSNEINILQYPCHTQAVERCVKLVTEASASVCGPESRDGFILARISSRENLPKIDTKKQFLEALSN